MASLKQHRTEEGDTTLQTVLQALARLDGSIDNLRTEMSRSIDGLTSAVDGIRTSTSSTSQWCIPGAASAVLDASGNAQDGVTATWTAIDIANDVYAISAAHCAFFYDGSATAIEGVLTPVFIPKCLVGLVQTVYVCPVEAKATQRLCDDVVLLRLKQVPSGVTPLRTSAFKVAPESVWKDEALKACESVRGETGACQVRGDSPRLNCNTPDPYYWCVEARVEPGNSGALAVGACGDPTLPDTRNHLLLGTYYGVMPKTNVKALNRSVIVPLPHLDDGRFLTGGNGVMKDFAVSQVLDGHTATVTVGTNLRCLQWDVSSNCHRDGEFSCVFIQSATRIGIDGQATAGAIGCVRAR